VYSSVIYTLLKSTWSVPFSAPRTAAHRGYYDHNQNQIEDEKKHTAINKGPHQRRNCNIIGCILSRHLPFTLRCSIHYFAEERTGPHACQSASSR
jgi:hypothetical protein